MAIPQIGLDTNVLIAALRSQRGASAKLLTLMRTGRFEVHLSVALVLEYEEVLMRHRVELGLSQDDVADLVDAMCSLARAHAEQEGISINQFILLAVAEKMAALDTQTYLAKRAQRGRRDKLLAVLAKAPDIEPEPNDRLE